MGNSNTPHSRQLRNQTSASRQTRIINEEGIRVSPIILEKEFASLWEKATQANGGNNTETLRGLLRKNSILTGIGGVVQDSGDARNMALASEVLAAFMGILNTARLAEQQAPEPSAAKVAALTAHFGLLADERSQLSNNPDLVDKALYIYAPLLRAAWMGGEPNPTGAV